MKDDLLALKADVFGPLHETGEVGGVANVLAWWVKLRGQQGKRNAKKDR